MLEVAVAAVWLRTCLPCSEMILDSSHHSGGLTLQDDVEIDLQDEKPFDQDSTLSHPKEHYCSLAYLGIANVLIKQ